MTSQHQTFHLGGGGQPPSSSNANQPVHDPQQPFNIPSSQNNSSAVASAAQHQQMAFGQNAALPGLDMSVLQGITPQQLALIAQLIQTGALPLPPPGSSSQLSDSTAQPTAVERTHSSGEVDREDGELDEGEVSDHQPRDFLSTPPKGPRRRSRSPVLKKKRARGNGAQAEGHSSSRVGSGQSSNTNAPSNAPRGPSALSNGQSSAHASNGLMNTALATPVNAKSSRKPSKDVATKEFILEMHRAGYGFDQVAKEVGNTLSLRRLYSNLNLPVSAADPAQAAQAEAFVSPTVSEQRPAVAPMAAAKRPAPKPAAADRSAYLAKLQAAKNKKSESAGSVPPEKGEQLAVQSVTSTQPIPRTAESQILPPAPQPAPTKVVVNTQLVRQRLEALNAARAQKATKPPLSDPAPTTTSVQQSANAGVPLSKASAREAKAVSTSVDVPDVSTTRTHLDAGNGGLPSGVAVQQAPPSASPSPSFGFGLPGLFTTRSPVAPGFPSPGRVTATHIPTADSRQVVEAAQNAPPVPSPLPAVQPQPFGQAMTSYSSESFIIEASSDEEGDGEDEQMSTKAKQPSIGLLPDFPPKLSTFKVTTSVPGTPGTPGVDLKRKLEELEEMKRKIARIEKKKTKPGPNAQGVKFAGGDSSAPSSTVNSGSVTPSKAAHSNLLIDSINASQAERTKLASPLGATSVKLKAAEQEKETLRQRLMELQAQGVEIPPATRALAQSPKPKVAVQNDTEPRMQPGSEPVEVEDDEMGDADDFYGDHDPESSTGDATSARTESQHIDDQPPSTEAIVPASQRTSSRGESAAGTEVLDAGDMVEGTTIDPTTSALAERDVYEPSSFDDDDDNMDDVYEPPPDPGPLPVLDTAPSASGSAAGTVTAEDPPENSTKVSETPDVSSTDDDDNADDYEPTEEVGVANDDAAQSPVSTDAMSESDSMSESDTSTPGDESATGSPNDADTDKLPPAATALADSSNSKGARIVDDGLAPGLQPTPEQHVVAEQQPQAPAGWYKPYTSPLFRFKDFRFHPSFLAAIPGGHKSLTYTHKIDPIKQLCPWELDGRCNDKSCSFQHFKSNNDLLRILGTERMPANDPETEKKWREGLTAVIKELRNTVQTQDVAAIAQRIAEFRREFIGDPTKTLLLKDT